MRSLGAIVFRFGLAWILLFLAGCKPASPSFKLSEVFPAPGAISGWPIAQDVKSYTHDNLFELVDGQADAFFAFMFEEVAVRRYQNDQGNQINVEVWQLAAPADACGLFLSNQSGLPAQVGNESALNTGRRLSFWQNRYYTAITANKSVPDETLLAFGAALSRVLPAGGERPALLKRLPQAGLTAGSALYFHQEISIQNTVWLGGNNLLGLSEKTDGAMGQYVRAGKKFKLLVVQYPGAGEAAKALQVLENAQMEGFVAARVQANLLGAVFGEPDSQAAKALIDEALK